MTAEHPRVGELASNDDAFEAVHLSDDQNTSAFKPSNSCTFHSPVLDNANGSSFAAAHQAAVASPSSNGKAQEKKAHQSGLDSLGVEESSEARLERLGRQRPEVFGSIWAEIGFVFSISMSQVLSVGEFLGHHEVLLTITRNTSSPGSL